MFNKLITILLPFMPKKMVWIFSKRYIAGETIEDGLKVSEKFNEEGILVTVDLLGEFIKTISEAEDNRNQYLDIVTKFSAKNIKGSFSLKPTMFGLLIDNEVCYSYIRDIVKFASGKNCFVQIDMEDSQCVDLTLDIFTRLREEFPANVGIVLQAYMRRTLDDLIYLSKINTTGNPINVRLCKGIYIEPEKIAFKKFKEVQVHFLKCLEFILQNKLYASIATHDKVLVEGAFNLLEKYKISKNLYEFQMLFGVTPELRKSIVEKNHTMRIYVPFGKEWFGYSTRRLKENPMMAMVIIKALFIRG